MEKPPKRPTTASQSPTGPPSRPPVPPRPVHTTGQPPLPQPTVHDQADVMGIISIVLALTGFSPVGLILGLVGASKAKREHYSPVLSRIGWIMSLVILVLTVLAVGAVIAVAVLYSSDHPEHASTRAVTYHTVDSTYDNYSLELPDDFQDIIDESTSSSVGIAQANNDSEYVLVIQEKSVIDFVNGMNAQDYANAINHTNYGPNDTITPLKGIKNPYGYSVADYEIDSVIDGTKTVSYVRYIATDNFFYQVITQTIPSRAPVVRGELFKIIESFQETWRPR